MWRTASVLVLLLGLLSWAVYDHQSKKNAENQIKTPVAASNTQDTAKIGIQKGNIAPNLELMTMNGFHWKLANERGKKVILNFWASWCPPCKAEMPNIEAFYKANKDHNVIVLAVNLTTTEKNKSQIQSFVKEQA